MRNNLNINEDFFFEGLECIKIENYGMKDKEMKANVIMGGLFAIFFSVY